MQILVTGASGFIGGRFAHFALDCGFRVRITARQAEAVTALVSRGAEFIRGDLSDPELASRLVEGVDAVVHCAGAAGVWGSRHKFYEGNVRITEHLVAACVKKQVRRFLHLSSPSVYFDGTSRELIREDQVPRQFSDSYGATKFEAEQRVLQAAAQGLGVIVFRPRFVIGAGDMTILPRIIGLHSKGWLSQIGNGDSNVDFTSINNLCHALHQGLGSDTAACGKVYNISNGTPFPMVKVLNYLFSRLGMLPVGRRLPYHLAYALACCNELLCNILPGKPEPAFFRLGVAVMAKKFTLDISQARQYLNYHPQDDLWETLDEFSGWWKSWTESSEQINRIREWRKY